jgi:hypothetical protein
MAVFNGAFPILPGKTDAARAFASEVTGARRHSFDEMLKRTGTIRETWSLQESPTSAMLLVWSEGNVDEAAADLASAMDDFSVWFRAQVKAITGIDMSAPPAGGPELLVDWAGSSVPYANIGSGEVAETGHDLDRGRLGDEPGYSRGVEPRDGHGE